MELYLSRYYFFIREGGQFYVYNVVSGSILRVSYRLFRFLRYFDNKSLCISGGRFNEKTINKLLENKILYSRNCSEQDFLRYKYLKDKYDDSFLSVVVLPTLKCNLDCHYCYEKEKNQFISDTNFEILKTFFAKQSQIRKYITVRWSGGEILTSWDKIKQLSYHIKRCCEVNNCDYVASAISNGTLLTPKIVNDMCDCNIYSLQVTLDGSREFHDKVRYFKNGDGTFNRIVSSIEIASQKMKVIVRINVDKKNFPSIEELFKSLSNRNINRNNIQLFCKPVICTTVRMPKNEIYSHKEFYDIEMRLLQLAELYNLPYAFHWGIKGYHVRCAYCGIQGYYLTPDLKLYKCPIYIDDGHDLNSIGFIDTNGNMVISNYPLVLKSLSYAPFDIYECKNCKVLPICHGKCPVIWELSGRKNDEGCIPEKYSIAQKIKYALRNSFQMHAYDNGGVI